MYDRYTITLKNDELALTLGVEVSEEYQRQFNAAPSKKLPVITSDKNQKISFFYWGLMSRWANNKTISPKLFNLPVSSLQTKASYKRKLKTHRCVIPMDGFYVWKQVSKKLQVPHYFYFQDRRVFSVAGLWEEEYDEQEGTSNSFIMVTKPANHTLNSFSESMPAIMDTAATRKWLESDDFDLEEILSSDYSKDLSSHTVSPKIKDISSNDVSFINPAPASDQHGNYTLFT